MVVLPASHPLAARESIRLQDIARETFIGITAAAPVFQSVMDKYTARNDFALKYAYEVENLAAATSLITSTGGVTLAPLYVENMLPSSVVVPPLQGEAPTIGLMMGYHKSNTSPLFKRFVSRADELAARVAEKEGPRRR